MYEMINPKEWGYKAPSLKGSQKIKEILGEDFESIKERIINCVYLFLDRLYDENEKGLRHYYRADNKFISELDNGNFLMALNYLVIYDMNGDKTMLEKAENCFMWGYENVTETHPMFTWQGGVRDGFKPNELYIKYTGDAFLTCNALYKRTKNEKYLFYIKQFHNFFKQGKKAGFKYKYDTNTYIWSDTGFVWRAFGFPVISYLELYEITKDEKYLHEALEWGHHGLTLQAEDGGFYLIDGEFWNSDLTAPELRSLVYLYEITKDKKFLQAAEGYADWLLKHQRDDGAWVIGIDKDGEECAPHVGPGDSPNIGISLLRLDQHVDHNRYFDSAVKAMKYSLALQAVEQGRYPLYLDDEHVKWGFWSWEPLMDYSLSGDQSVHHIRGLLFMSYYIETFKL